MKKACPTASGWSTCIHASITSPERPLRADSEKAKPHHLILRDAHCVRSSGGRLFLSNSFALEPDPGVVGDLDLHGLAGTEDAAFEGLKDADALALRFDGVAHQHAEVVGACDRAFEQGGIRPRT